MNAQNPGMDTKGSNGWVTPSTVRSNRFKHTGIAPTNTTPILTILSSLVRDKQLTQGETKEDGMKNIKRVVLLVNVVGIIVCTSLLINRSTICIEK